MGILATHLAQEDGNDLRLYLVANTFCLLEA